jgi:hypothetical protein
MGNWLEQPSRRARFRLLQRIFVGTTFDFFVRDTGFPRRPKVDILEPSQRIRRTACFRSERQVAYKISGLLEGKGPEK